jgi:hypothetical protein
MKGFFKVWLAIFGLLSSVIITICLTIASFFVSFVFGALVSLFFLTTWITVVFYMHYM